VHRRTAIAASVAVLVGAGIWAVVAVPRSYVEAQLAVGDDLRRLLADHPAIATTALHDVVFAVVYAAAGTVLLRALRVRFGVVALLVVAVADVVENLSLRVMAQRGSLGSLDELMRTAGVVKWIGVVAVVLLTVTPRTRHG